MTLQHIKDAQHSSKGFHGYRPTTSSTYDQKFNTMEPCALLTCHPNHQHHCSRLMRTFEEQSYRHSRASRLHLRFIERGRKTILSKHELGRVLGPGLGRGRHRGYQDAGAFAGEDSVVDEDSVEDAVVGTISTARSWHSRARVSSTLVSADVGGPIRSRSWTESVVCMNCARLFGP